MSEQKRGVHKLSSKPFRNVIFTLKWIAMLRRTSYFQKSLSEKFTPLSCSFLGCVFPSVSVIPACLSLFFCHSRSPCLHLLVSLSFCWLSKSFLLCSHFFREKINKFICLFVCFFPEVSPVGLFIKTAKLPFWRDLTVSYM